MTRRALSRLGPIALGPIALGLSLVAALLAPADAAAQLTPGAGARVEPSLGVGARVLRGVDGRIRRAWALEVAVDGAGPSARAADFLARHGGTLALAPGASLREARVHSAHGLDTVRYETWTRGARLVGATVVVRLREDRVVYVGADGGDVRLVGSHRLAPSAAVARVAAPEERLLSAERAWLALDGEAVPVLRLDLAGDRRARRRRVIVDARDGAVLGERPLASDALGRIYMTNPRSDMNATVDVDLPSLTSRDRITGRFFRVLNCNPGARGCEPAQLAVADVNGDFLYDPEEPAFEDPFAEVHTYFHANRAAEHFRDVHGFTWACGTETLMRVFVNYAEAPRTPYDNAAYSPSSGAECGFMLFGQGATQDFAYDSDVIYHEFGHAVVDQVSDLGFFFVDGLGAAYDPLAVNEGVADYFAATISGDPRMAEYFEGTGMAGESALRNLDNSLVCPNDLVGEGHFDGRIWAGAGWDLREALGVEKADALVFSAISAVPETVSLAELAEVLTASAASLEASGVLEAADLDVVAGVLAARGLAGCERVVPLDDGEPRLGYSGTGQITVAAGAGIAPVRYRVDVPADATSVRLSLTRLSAGGTFRVIATTGEAPPRFRATARPPLRGEELTPDVDGRIVWSPGGAPDLPRCETLQIAVLTDDLATVGAALYQIAAEIERDGSGARCDDPDAGPAAPADGGVDDAGPSDLVPGGGGCGCRVGDSRRGSLGWAMAGLLCALGFAARRRRG